MVADVGQSEGLAIQLFSVDRNCHNCKNQQSNSGDAFLHTDASYSPAPNAYAFSLCWLKSRPKRSSSRLMRRPMIAFNTSKMKAVPIAANATVAATAMSWVVNCPGFP